MAMDEQDAAILAFTRSYGLPVPQYVFPAIITGRAWPQHLSRPGVPNVSINPDIPCSPPTEPGSTDDCSLVQLPDANGYYPDEFLPCGIQPIRYRWVAIHDPGLHSEGCGFLEADPEFNPGQFEAWRQAFYAVNVAHRYQEVELNYDPIVVGTNVHMAYGDISLITGGNPQYGFYFSVMTDPDGTKTCPLGGNIGQATGCCRLVDNITQLVVFAYCTDAIDCQNQQGSQFETWFFDGLGVDCPEFFGECADPQDFEEVCCVVTDIASGIELFHGCIERTFCEDFDDGSNIVTITAGGETPCPDDPCSAGNEGGDEPGGVPIFLDTRRAVTMDYKVGGCPGNQPP